MEGVEGFPWVGAEAGLRGGSQLTTVPTLRAVGMGCGVLRCAGMRVLGGLRCFGGVGRCWCFY